MQKQFLTAFAILLLSAGAVVGRPARLILIRHAEKPPDPSDVHLSEKGQLRARGLAGLLTTNLAIIPAGPPTALFAPKFTRRGRTRRPYETLQPLAGKLKLSIQTPFGADEWAAFAKFISSTSSLDGKTVVVCWIHDYLPDMAAALGVEPKPAHWKESVYDRVWIITYQGDRAIMKDLPQNVLPGDSTE
jgi:hypothetical protein